MGRIFENVGIGQHSSLYGRSHRSYRRSLSGRPSHGGRWPGDKAYDSEEIRNYNSRSYAVEQERYKFLHNNDRYDDCNLD